MNSPEDSLVIKEWYSHPDKSEGQGIYVMFYHDGRITRSFSGNELRRVYLMNPSRWLSGPIFLPLSAEDYKRIRDRMDELFC